MNPIKVVILYGSQTGNAQDLAERLWRKIKLKGFKTQLSSFDNFDLNGLFEDKIRLICVCSTTGQGDVPDNMLQFWRSIMRKNIPAGFLDGLNFFMIGLGDSSYDKYNFTAKKLYKRFVQLGARSPHDLCLCDEQNSDGIEGTFSRWLINFWPLLPDAHDAPDANILSFSKYKLTYLNELTRPVVESNLPINETNPFQAKLLSNQRVTETDHWQDVRLIELDCPRDRVKYECGDVLMLRPSNTTENMRKFYDVFQHVNFDSNRRIKIEPNFVDEIQVETEINETLVRTVGDLVERYFDMNSVPRMSFFEMFAQLAEDELEKEKLNEFLTPEGLEDLYTYCYRPRRNILEIFADFPKTSKNVKNIETLLDLVPSMKPRAFSIASSPYVHQNRLQILVAVVEYKTRLFESRKGTCSYWLSTLNSDDHRTIPVWIKPGSFKIDLDKPLICIGPGTGVAPFRSIINERIFKLKLTDNELYFGCRSKDKDYYFEREWTQIEHDHPGMLNVHAAFSRDQPEKIYVQDLLLKNEQRVFDLIMNGQCYVLIAGNSKRMPQDVLAILEKIIIKNLFPHDESKAKDFIKTLETQKRIQLETWS